MIQSPVHLNLNIYASVYVDTTGPLVGFHDVHRVCIIPLDNFLQPAKGVTPFLVTFKPIHEESPWLMGAKYAHAKATGIHPYIAPDVLSLWAQRLPKQKDKKLVPIAYNWPFASAFLKQLFGPDTFDEVFFEAARDVLSVAAYINDSCSLNVEEIPFPRCGIQSICNRLNIQIDEPQDTLNTCRVLSLIYNLQLKRMFKGVVL